VNPDLAPYYRYPPVDLTQHYVGHPEIIFDYRSELQFVDAPDAESATALADKRQHPVGKRRRSWPGVGEAQAAPDEGEPTIPNNGLLGPVRVAAQLGELLRDVPGQRGAGAGHE
jgi:hypothetical protein